MNFSIGSCQMARPLAGLQHNRWWSCRRSEHLNTHLLLLQEIRGLRLLDGAGLKVPHERD